MWLEPPERPPRTLAAADRPHHEAARRRTATDPRSRRHARRRRVRAPAPSRAACPTLPVPHPAPGRRRGQPMSGRSARSATLRGVPTAPRRCRGCGCAGPSRDNEPTSRGRRRPKCAPRSTRTPGCARARARRQSRGGAPVAARLRPDRRSVRGTRGTGEGTPRSHRAGLSDGRVGPTWDTRVWFRRCRIRGSNRPSSDGPRPPRGG